MSSDEYRSADSEPNHLPSPPPLPPDSIPPGASEPPVLELAEEPPRRRSVVRPPHPGFWWAILWGVGFHIVQLFAMVAALIVAVVLKAIASGNPEAYVETLKNVAPGRTLPDEVVQLMIPGFAAALLAFFLYPWLAVRLVLGREWPRRVALNLPSATHTMLALFSLPGLVVLASGIASWAHEFCKTYGIPHMGNQAELRELAAGWPVWFSILAVAVGPGIGEEILCRGFFGRGLVGRYGAVMGILLTSAVFGLMHLDPPVVVGTAFIGLWLHYVYLHSRSLMLPMLLHFLNNSLAVLVVALGINDPTEDGGDTSRWLYAGAVALLFCMAWAFWLSRARLVPTGDGPGWQPPFPGVEAPPPGSGTAVEQPWPTWSAVFAALLGVTAFLACVYFSQLHG